MNFPDAFTTYYTGLGLSKITSLRKEILYLLWCAKKPLKAYEILHQLLVTKLNATPPAVYRTLDYFVTHGVLHKIDSIQSYALCSTPSKQLSFEVLMVCDVCHHVIELYDETLHALVLTLSERQQFRLHQDIIELRGVCQGCVDSEVK